MKLGFSSESTLRLGLPLIVVLMVASSPFVTLSNPVLLVSAAAASSLDVAPSTISQSGNDDFNTQAALTSLFSRQTNNIAGIQSYYDVLFTTATTGTIKFIDITFPPGIGIGPTPQVIDIEGIGDGTATKTSTTQIRYTVNSAVSIPAGTQIRLEFMGLVNPSLPDNDYKVIVTTRNAAEGAIDGPTQSNLINIQQIGTGQLADFSVTRPKIAIGAVDTNQIEFGAVTTLEIANGAVTNSRIADNALSLPGFQRASPIVNVPPNTLGSAIATCNPGETVVGGGFQTAGASANQIFVSASFSPADPPRSWQVDILNDDNVNTAQLEVVAICIPPFP